MLAHASLTHKLRNIIKLLPSLDYKVYNLHTKTDSNIQKLIIGVNYKKFVTNAYVLKWTELEVS